jgi:MFS family permease
VRLTSRDWLATILVVAIGIPYVGYLVNGEMPFVEDPRGMSAVGLVLGAAAFAVLWSGHLAERFGKGPTLTAAGALLFLGLVAFAFAETAAAEILLAVFLGALLIGLAFVLADRAGLVHPRVHHGTHA